MSKQNEVQFVTAAQIMAEVAADGGVISPKPEYPQRCATGELYLKLADGRMVDIGMTLSLLANEDGSYKENSTSSPAVIWQTVNGAPDAEYSRIETTGFNPQTRQPFVRQKISAKFRGLIHRMSHHTPKAKAPIAQAENLGSPTAVEMPI